MLSSAYLLKLFTITLLFTGFSYFKTSSPHYKRGQGPVKGTGLGNNRLPSRQLITVFLIIVAIVTVPAILKRSASYGRVDGNGVQKDHIRGTILPFT